MLLLKHETLFSVSRRNRMTRESGTSKDPKETLYNWKSAVGLIIGIFIAGVVSVITVTGYLNDQALDRFYQLTSGQLLEQRVNQMETSSRSQEIKLDQLRESQTVILLKIGEMNSKLDSLSHRRDQ